MNKFRLINNDEIGEKTIKRKVTWFDITQCVKEYDKIGEITDYIQELNSHKKNVLENGSQISIEGLTFFDYGDERVIVGDQETGKAKFHLVSINDDIFVWRPLDRLYELIDSLAKSYVSWINGPGDFPTDDLLSSITDIMSFDNYLVADDHDGAAALQRIKD